MEDHRKKAVTNENALYTSQDDNTAIPFTHRVPQCPGVFGDPGYQALSCRVRYIGLLSNILSRTRKKQVMNYFSATYAKHVMQGLVTECSHTDL